jgi:hypothetical protein
MENIFHSRL